MTDTRTKAKKAAKKATRKSAKKLAKKLTQKAVKSMTKKAVLSRGGTRPGAGRPKGRGPYGESTKPVRLPLSKIDKVLHFVKHGSGLPLFSSADSAVVAQPDNQFELTDHLVPRPATTFFFRVNDDSMTNAGIDKGTLLVVDRSIKPSLGNIVVAVVDDHLVVRRLQRKYGHRLLAAENKRYESTKIRNNAPVQGVVTSVIRSI